MNNNELNNDYQSRYKRNNQNNLYEQNNNNLGNMQPIIEEFNKIEESNVL